MEHINLDREIGLRVSGAIEQAGTSRRSVAEAIGISKTTLGRKLLGTTAFTVPELGRIAAHLGVSWRSLVPEELIAAAAA